MADEPENAPEIEPDEAQEPPPPLPELPPPVSEPVPLVPFPEPLPEPPRMICSVATNEDGIVVASGRSNVVQEGAVEVSEDLYRQIRGLGLGRCKFDGTTATPYEPPPPPPPPLGVSGNYLWTAINDLGWLPIVQQAINASQKPLDVQYANSTGKAETIYATDSKWGRIMKAAAALGQAAQPPVSGISLAVAVQHGLDLIAGGT